MCGKGNRGGARGGAALLRTLNNAHSLSNTNGSKRRGREGSKRAHHQCLLHARLLQQAQREGQQRAVGHRQQRLGQRRGGQGVQAGAALAREHHGLAGCRHACSGSVNPGVPQLARSIQGLGTAMTERKSREEGPEPQKLSGAWAVGCFWNPPPNYRGGLKQPVKSARNAGRRSQFGARWASFGAGLCRAPCNRSRIYSSRALAIAKTLRVPPACCPIIAALQTQPHAYSTLQLNCKAAGLHSRPGPHLGHCHPVGLPQRSVEMR